MLRAGTDLPACLSSLRHLLFYSWHFHRKLTVAANKWAVESPSTSRDPGGPGNKICNVGRRISILPLMSDFLSVLWGCWREVTCHEWNRQTRLTVQKPTILAHKMYAWNLTCPHKTHAACTWERADYMMGHVPGLSCYCGKHQWYKHSSVSCQLLSSSLAACAHWSLPWHCC